MAVNTVSPGHLAVGDNKGGRPREDPSVLVATHFPGYPVIFSSLPV